MVWYNKKYAADLSIIQPIEQAIYAVDLETNRNVTWATKSTKTLMIKFG
jgi:hypothetical protein